MIVLDSTNKLQFVPSVAAATTESQIVASWVDVTSSASTPGITTTITSSTTAIDSVPAPAGGTQRLIKSMFIENADTSNMTLTIRTNSSGTTRIVYLGTLSPGDVLQYEDGAGFSVLDANAQLRIAGNASGRLIRAPQYLTAGTTYTPPTNCTYLDVEMVAGGGAGGGGAQTAANAAAGGGGGAGGYARKGFINPGSSALTYAIGAGGTIGTAGNNPGNNGTDTTFACNGVTVTAKGGTGGTGMAAGTAGNVALGGAGGVAGTNGDVNPAGSPGETGIILSGTVGCAGGGASTIFGSGGYGTSTEAAGAAATGYGAGGGGGLCLGTTARSGGGGAPGLIIIREYY